MNTEPQTFLPHDAIVVELGQRLGAGLCGSLLAELGATVIAVEAPALHPAAHEKAAYRDSVTAGKRSLSLDVSRAGDVDLVARLVRGAAVTIVSSDTDPVWAPAIAEALRDGGIVCNVTAFGERGPLAGVAHDDAAIQALGGSMDTSGETTGAPVLCRAPIMETSAALYAAAGIVLALRVRRRENVTQNVGVAAFDGAITMLATFLPKHFAGATVQRIGNHHPGMSPWNTYRARDGWVLMCAGTDDQWRRICAVIARPDLLADPRFASNADRVRHAAEADAQVEAWTQRFTIAECVDAFNAAAISTGPILTIPDLRAEPNLAQREMVRAIGYDGRSIAVPGSVFRGSAARGVAPSTIPARDADRAWCEGVASRPASRGERSAVTAPALAGVRVLEMGQFTTAPLVGRQLGAFGADVVKLEPAGGEPSRHMPPFRDGQGYFFTLSNSDKRVMTMDLRDPARVALLERLIAKADILVENTKPGTLPRFGFTPERVLELNPRIVYCDISGFGGDTPFAGRGAMDTTIQGLAGTMDLTRDGDVPYKTGISIGDLHAGQFALVAVLAALEFRDRTGRGQYLDLAMLDAASWATRTAWNAASHRTSYRTLRCNDGFVLVRSIAGREDAAAIAGEQLAAGSRADAVASFARIGCVAVPVLTLHEAVGHAQTEAAGVIVSGHGDDGTMWPMLASPIELSASPARVGRALGALDSDAIAIRTDWQVA